jgi:hypothetical protein
MADTTVYYSALLAQVDSKISGLIENPQVDYQVGGGNGTVRISASQKMDQLLKVRQMIMTRLTSKPSEEIEILQNDMTCFGEDLNDYMP